MILEMRIILIYYIRVISDQNFKEISMNDNWLTAVAAAKILGVSIYKLNSDISRGKLHLTGYPSLSGIRVFYNRKQVEASIGYNKHEPAIGHSKSDSSHVTVTEICRTLKCSSNSFGIWESNGIAPLKRDSRGFFSRKDLETLVAKRAAEFDAIFSSEKKEGE